MPRPVKRAVRRAAGREWGLDALHLVCLLKQPPKGVGGVFAVLDFFGKGGKHLHLPDGGKWFLVIQQFECGGRNGVGLIEKFGHVKAMSNSSAAACSASSRLIWMVSGDWVD